MLKKIIAVAAAGAFMIGAGFANDCVLEGEAPVMPDPKTATAEERAATIEAIKGFQAQLGEYRACLTTISDNEENEAEAREAALKEFNRTVKIETDMVKDWQKFDKKYQKANK